jgi:hypothetical protein
LLADTFDISGVYAGTNSSFSGPYTCADASSNPQYIFIRTTNYFSRFQMNVGDNIQIGNFAFADPSNGVLQDFTNWINRPTGFFVAGIGHTDASGTYHDGPNNVGYANYIIIQAQYQDPTSGSVGLRPYGGGSIRAYIGSSPVALANPPRRLINLSRQIQLVFRIITREMDPVAQLRPDNM